MKQAAKAMENVDHEALARQAALVGIFCSFFFGIFYNENYITNIDIFCFVFVFV